MVKPHELAKLPEGTPDVPPRPHAPLGSTLRDLLEAPTLRDTFRMLFQQELLPCRVGWPRLLSGDPHAQPARAALASRWLRTSDVVIELSQAPARESFAAGIVLQAESAARLVDWLLGAPGNSGAPSAASQPSEAECGVLAYAAARLCASLASHASDSWIVRDVRPVREQESTWSTPLVFWPVSLDTPVGPLSGALLLTDSTARASHEHVLLRVAVSDLLAADALDDLAVGDALVSDRWLFTSTTEGPTGRVRLSVDGTDTCFDAQLAEGTLTARSVDTRPTSDHVQLVLGTCSASLWQLAELASGAPCALSCSAQDEVELQRDGTLVARGSLVWHRGALGIRVTQLGEDVNPAD